MEFGNKGNRHACCTPSILQAIIHQVIFQEIPLSRLRGQVATDQLAAIDTTILLFKTLIIF